MKRTNERIDRKTAGRGGVLAGFVFAFLTLFLVGAVTETGAQPIVDLMNNQLNKLKNQDKPKPGVEVSCSLVVSPSHGNGGKNVTITATASSREASLVGAELTIGVWEPGMARRVHDVTGRFGAGGIFETSWTVPARTDSTVRGFDVRLHIPNREGGTACTDTRHFWYDEPPVISLDCGEARWELNKSHRVTADVKRADDYTATWFVDGNKVEERTGRMSSASIMVNPLPEGTHTVKVVFAGSYGTSEAECSRKVEAKFPRVIITSHKSQLTVNEQGESCMQWEAYSDGPYTSMILIPDVDHEEERNVGKTGTGCFNYTFTKAGFFTVNLLVKDSKAGTDMIAGAWVYVCPAGQKECRGGCIKESDVCCPTGAAGSCPQGQQCCGNVCCAGGEVCDATNNACCPAGSTFIAGKGICCPASAPDVCGDKCMPAGATCCTSYHCTGATNYVCCNDGKCCPSGNICCSDGGCCPAGRVCSANSGCSCPADRPVPCGPNCCASGQICKDNQCTASCLPPACCPEFPSPCKNLCMPSGAQCCSIGDGWCLGGPCCGTGCCDSGWYCCPDNAACCPQNYACVVGGCCPQGFKSCKPEGGSGCCQEGTECCGGSNCCRPGTCNRATGQCTGAAAQSLECSGDGCTGIQGTQQPLIEGRGKQRTTGIQGSPQIMYTGQAAPANTLPLLLK